METLPNELILEIFNNILKITDRRHFLRTCNLYNKLTKQSMCEFELNYKYPDFKKLNYSVEKFTLELCHDSYFNLIPGCYINDDNLYLIRCLSYYNNLPMLKFAKTKGCRINKTINKQHLFNLTTSYEDYANVEWTCAFAAQNGHVSILKFLLENNCICNYNTYIFAVENGRLDVLKYLYEYGGEMDKMFYKLALKRGQIEIIKWFEEVDCNGRTLHFYDMEQVD